MSLPRGYDNSKYLKEHVLLKSDASLEHWNVIARSKSDASGSVLFLRQGPRMETCCDLSGPAIRPTRR